MTDTNAPFAPDWVSPPGDTILDLIEERGWTQAELADRLGYSRKHVNQLVKGTASLTEDAAVRLDRVLGGSVSFWLTREAQYRARCARREAKDRYAGWVSWLDNLPVRELMNAGAIPKRRIDSKSKPGLVEDCLRFFGIASPDEWQARCLTMEGAFRKSRVQKCDAGAISVWLRLGEKKAEGLHNRTYDSSFFEKSLYEIRSLTTKPPEEFEPYIRNLLDRAGVGFVLVPAIPRARVSGAARWLGRGHPLIQLSLYGKTNDRFWFTFFHEAAHILLHGEDRKAVWLDDSGGGKIDTAETEADAWASDMLIPSCYMAEICGLAGKASVLAFAKKINIHPGIVVGRLQHEKLLDYRHMNDLKVRFEFAAKADA